MKYISKLFELFNEYTVPRGISASIRAVSLRSDRRVKIPQQIGEGLL
ncbi:hypothetical protein BXY39_3804 [Eilatimonas milleporae]|uniref:Uncharacterized protein n=1 Tax=Eilatimonas milleporae TaxID=911205 RepID=A0A3M0C1C7_9PROT|nr:hypothetical protein BXY39_3804 [Eilatimonas milleporae]